MRGFSAPLMLVAARARRRPGRWLPTAIGIAIAVAFAGAVIAESTIAGDQSARDVLRQLPALDRSVQISWKDVVNPAVQRQARALLRRLGVDAQTEVVLMNPVRLSGIVVRLAAIAPLSREASSLKCTASSCPMLIAGGSVSRKLLAAQGIRIPIVGSTHLSSAAPLGFAPGSESSEPVLVTGDINGLESQPGLSGVYRSHTWLAPLPADRLHSWDLASTQERLQQTQAALLSAGSGYSLTAPFDGLTTARDGARTAPDRLLLAGGGALAALAVFVVLVAGALRRDQRDELNRLRTAGARTGQCATFVVGEAAWVSAAGLIAGAALGIAVTAVLSDLQSAPLAGVLAHSLLTPAGAAALAAGWLCSTALIVVVCLAPGAGAADVLAVAAVAALALALTRGDTSNDPLPVLLAPLCCIAAGVLIFRGTAAVLRGGERVARRGPVLARLALVNLARAPNAPALAIAFMAVSIGLGGFALAYRATLLRGTADQAADRVPLDATVTPGADFATPLQRAPIARWRSLAGGMVTPVRRTEATLATGGGTVTVPAIGVPADVLTHLHGWRAGDGSEPITQLAARLTPPGPARTPGPILPPSARTLSVSIFSPALALIVTADLRGANGAITQLPLHAANHPELLVGAVPRGTWELQALELQEPAGLEITNGHQNGESAAPATQFTATVNLRSVRALDRGGQSVVRVSLESWRGIGAASGLSAGKSGLALRFAASGMPGILRPPQPSDIRPLPVLADQQTAQLTSRAGNVALTVDGQRVTAHIAGVLKRFPTLPPDAAGFVIADEATLASALDAQLPGQGRPDELWLSVSRPKTLRGALASSPLASLNATFRADIEHQLRAAPIARGVLGVLIAAAVLSGALAAIGLLLAMLGAAREQSVERDLAAQGVGAHGLRSELRARMMLVSVLGACLGVAVAAVLTQLAVSAVRAAGSMVAPRPPLVTVAPWPQLALWGLLAIAVGAACTWAGTRTVLRGDEPA